MRLLRAVMNSLKLAPRISVISPAHAQLSEKQVTAWNNVQQEITECVAYLRFGVTCAPETATKEDLKPTEKSIERMTDLAVQIGNEIGMTTDAMLNRLQIAIQGQMKLTERKCVNFSSLLAIYGQRCKLVGEHPETIFMEYMNKK